MFWLRYSHNGHQYRMPLKTSDEREAITRALDIQADPELAPTNTLKREIEAYVADRLHNRLWTKNNAYNMRSILVAMADFVGIKEPARLSADHLQQWYDDLKDRAEKPLTEYSAHAYMRAVRTFLKYLVAARKLRHNVADGVKMSKPRKVARQRFCDKATVDLLIKNCVREDLKFVLYCGFHAGLRKEEIIQARAEWFDLDQGLRPFAETGAAVVVADDVTKSTEGRGRPARRSSRSCWHQPGRTAGSFRLMNHVRHHTPDHEFLVRGDFPGWKFLIPGFQEHPVVPAP